MDSPTLHHREHTLPVWVGKVLITMLSIAQGLPSGLIIATIPLLLQEKGYSYTEIGTFGLCAYPYSIKFLWTPVIDSVYSNSVGRRKTWILPLKAICGLLMIYVSMHIVRLFSSIPAITLVFLLLSVLASTLESAVDAFTITLLPSSETQQVAVYQALGWNIGYFLSYTIFIALNSGDFCNKWFRTNPAKEGMISLESYIAFCGLFYLVCFIMVYYTTERDEGRQKHMTISDVYVKLYTVIMSSPQAKFLVFVLFFEKIAFVVVDAAYMLRLIQRGFAKEDMSTIVMLTLPCEIIFPIMIGQMMDNKPLMNLWVTSYRWNLGVYVLVTLVVSLLPSSVAASFWIILAVSYLYSLSNNIMYLAQGAVFVKICDPSISASYISLLNTISNLGIVWPAVFAMMLIDYFSGDCSTSVEETCEATNDGFLYVSMLFMFLGLLFTMIFHRRLIETQSH